MDIKSNESNLVLKENVRDSNITKHKKITNFMYIRAFKIQPPTPQQMTDLFVLVPLSSPTILMHNRLKYIQARYKIKNQKNSIQN